MEEEHFKLPSRESNDAKTLVMKPNSQTAKNTEMYFLVHKQPLCEAEFSYEGNEETPNRM